MGVLRLCVRQSGDLEHLSHKLGDLLLKVPGILVQRLIGGFQMVVGAVCAHTMHVQTAEILIQGTVQPLQQGFPRLCGYLLRVGLHAAAVVPGVVHVGGVVEPQPLHEPAQVSIIHAAVVGDKPVHLRTFSQIIAKAVDDQVYVVDIALEVYQRALLGAAAPQRHNGQRAVALTLHDFVPGGGGGRCSLVWLLLAVLMQQALALAVLCVAGVAALLVQYGVHGLVWLQAPEPDTSAQGAVLLVIQRRKLGQLEHIQMVVVPKAKAFAVDAGKVAQPVKLLVKAFAQIRLCVVLARQGDAVCKAVCHALHVEPVEGVAFYGLRAGSLGDAVQLVVDIGKRVQKVIYAGVQLLVVLISLFSGTHRRACDVLGNKALHKSGFGCGVVLHRFKVLVCSHLLRSLCFSTLGRLRTTLNTFLCFYIC